MKTTQHTIDANVPHNGSALLTRIVYRYEPNVDGMAFLFVVDARTLYGDKREPVNATIGRKTGLTETGATGRASTPSRVKPCRVN